MPKATLTNDLTVRNLKSKRGEAARLTLAQLADRYIEKYAREYKYSWATDKALLDCNVIALVASIGMMIFYTEATVRLLHYNSVYIQENGTRESSE